MKVKTIRKFMDIKEKKIREVGQIFEVTKKRYEEINSTTHGILIEEVKGAKKNEQSI